MPAADTSTNILIPNSRILYVDPNDIFGHVNGVPITPDYSDFCISFNLECEIVARYKTNEIIGVSDNGKFGIGFTHKMNVGENHWASLLQGEAYGQEGHRVLTTYYTDINYDDYIRETVVEGLGVEQVSIAYESYYTPNITIKFVDHRGVALFGREEATHFNDKLTVDNIFGAFFTIPYPKFRLQVKGFLGKAVTYQLSCTSFKGSLNAKTGNFEAVATFIGYDYSLLTDIPFEYLVAAPYCEYFGKDYWEEHKTQEDWRMIENYEGDETPTFFELIQRINAAFTKEGLLEVVSEEEKRTLDTANLEVDTLTLISEIYNNFLNSIDDRIGHEDSKIRNYEPGKPVENAQILYMSNETAMGNWVTPKSHWDYLMSAIETYNSTYSDNKITKEILPTAPVFENITLTPFFVRANNGEDIAFKDIKKSSVEELSKVKINGNQITESLAQAIIDFMNKAHSKGNILPNVYLLNCNGLDNFLEKRISELKTNVDEITKQKERNYIHLAITYLGMVPYIGNIFKLIMCHIETFIHMMFQCYNNIKTATENGQRTPEYLGIRTRGLGGGLLDVGANRFGFTDVVPPWPAVNRIVDRDNEYSEFEAYDTYGWVGDFSPYFEEAKLVRSLYLACKRTSKDPSLEEGEEVPVNILYVPVIPNDLNNNLNPFADGEKTLSSMAGMVGIRAAQVFGIGEQDKIDDNLAKTLGKMDALNYYRFIGTKDELNSLYTQAKDNLANTLYDIMLCKPSADNAGTVEEGNNTVGQEFEIAVGVFADSLTQKGRHPIFDEKGSNGKLSYTYMPTKSHYGIVPANTMKWSSYISKFIPDGDEKNRYFKFTIYESGGNFVSDSFLHKCSSKQLFEDYGNPENANRYVNNEMYFIVTKPSLIKGIMNRYDEMMTGTVRVLGENIKLDMSKVLDRYWIVSKKNRYDYQSKTYGYFMKSYGVENKYLLTKDGIDTTAYVLETYNKMSNANYCLFSDDELKDKAGNVVDVKQTIVPKVFFYTENGKAGRTLFGVDFYYQQNEIADTNVRERVKALLFLRSLPYEYKSIMHWDDDKIKHSSIVRVPFGFAALYGALLWRHNYIKQTGTDPIVCGNYKKLYSNNVEYDPVIRTPSKHIRVGVLNSGSKLNYEFTVFKQGDSRFYMFSREPDHIVANEMLRVFDEFLVKHWKIISQLELIKSDGTLFTGQSFKAHIEELIKQYEEAWNKASQAAQDIANEQAMIEQLEEDTNIGNTDTNTDTNTDETDPTTQETQEQQDAPVDPETLKAERYKECANALKNAAATFKSFTVNYCFMWYYWKEDYRHISLWFNPSNTKVQSALRSVYIDECIELRTGAWTYHSTNETKPSTFTDITVNQSNLKSYLDGFAEQISVILGHTNNEIGNGEDPVVVEATKEFNRDAALPIYLYLKMLWDKWLVSLKLNDHPFMVKNFEKNFIFIDSFYRNIKHRFMMNCQTILECYENNVKSNSDITVFKFIGDITTQHHCLFVAVPYFIENWAHEDSTKAADALRSIFKPIPYSEMSPPDENNKFVTIFIPKLSESPSELNNFRDDGFNIWSYNDVSKNDQSIDSQKENLPEVLWNIENFDWDKQGDLTRYGYYVPSFGFAYGRQNNHIFKNVNLSMDTPIITSAVINTLNHAARRGANNTHRIAYIGEDIYPVFSNYSYMCEFEMMGCAQMQPLMYFQLMNVPMWRGTYITISVSHEMTPGNMVTKVKAMKLSNRAVPYSNAWFTENPNFDPEALRKALCLEELVSGKHVINIEGAVANAPSSDGSGSGSGDVGGLDGFDIGAGKIEIVNGKFVNKNDPSGAANVAKMVYKAIVAAGGTDACAKGILCNMQYESGMNPRIWTWDGNKGEEKGCGPGGGLCGWKYPGGLRWLATSFGGWTEDQLKQLREKIKSQIPHPVYYSSAEKKENQNYITSHFGDFPFTLDAQVKAVTHWRRWNEIKNYTDPAAASNFWEAWYEVPGGVHKGSNRWSKTGSKILNYLK